MSIRVSILSAMLLASVPAMAQSQVQAVPRAGVSVTSTVTVKVVVAAVDPDTRTIVFSTPEGRLVNVAVGDGVKNLDSVQDGASADITYNQIVTLLNLRQKGPGSREARREGAAPDATDTEIGRFTVTVTAVDLANKKVSVIDGRGGPVRTYAAANPEGLKKVKVGDVVIGVTTPLLVTAITPAK
jgi:hypothetical protein